MTPEEARSRLLDYVYGEMSPQEATEFEGLIAIDPVLKAEVESFMEVRSVVSKAHPMELPVEIREHIMRAARRAIRGEQRFISWLERIFMSPAISVGVMVVLVAGVGIHMSGNWSDSALVEHEMRLERASAPEPIAEEVQAAGRKTTEDSREVQDVPKKTQGRIIHARKLPPAATKQEDIRPKAHDKSSIFAASSARMRTEETPLEGARRLVREGRLSEALEAYEKALPSLTGDERQKALAEAAEVASRLGLRTKSEVFTRQLQEIQKGPAPSAQPPVR